jgi:hypothetical protein
MGNRSNYFVILRTNFLYRDLLHIVDYIFGIQKTGKMPTEVLLMLQKLEKIIL